VVPDLTDGDLHLAVDSEYAIKDIGAAIFHKFRVQITTIISRIAPELLQASSANKW